MKLTSRSPAAASSRNSRRVEKIDSSRATSRTSTQPASSGWNSHLWASRASESACSIPASSRAALGGEDGRGAEGAVDVEPQPLGPAQGGQVGQRVDAAGAGRARGGDDAERPPPGRPVGRDRARPPPRGAAGTRGRWPAAAPGTAAGRPARRPGRSRSGSGRRRTGPPPPAGPPAPPGGRRPARTGWPRSRRRRTARRPPPAGRTAPEASAGWPARPRPRPRRPARSRRTPRSRRRGRRPACPRSCWEWAHRRRSAGGRPAWPARGRR